MVLKMGFSGFQSILERVYDGVVPQSGYRVNHTEDVFCCWYIRHGEARLRSQYGNVRALPGQWVFLPSGLKRDQDFQAQTQLLSLRFILEADGQQPLFLPGSALVIDGDDATQLELTAKNISQRWHLDHLKFPIATALGESWLAFMSDWWRLVTTQERWQLWDQLRDVRLTHALHILFQQQQAVIPWDVMESKSGFSRRHLDRLCNQQTGRSMSEIHQVRLLSIAYAQLADNELPIKAIASRLGFADASSFARWFRRQTGFSPRNGRRKALV